MMCTCLSLMSHYCTYQHGLHSTKTSCSTRCAVKIDLAAGKKKINYVLLIINKQGIVLNDNSASSLRNLKGNNH